MISSSSFIVYPKGQMPPMENCLMAQIDGAQNASISSFYKHLATALKFPDYFGHNLDSLDEILNDLSWVDEKKIVINIQHSGQFLSKAADGDVSNLMDLLSSTCSQWKQMDDKSETKKEFTVMIEQSDRMDKLIGKH